MSIRAPFVNSTKVLQSTLSWENSSIRSILWLCLIVGKMQFVKKVHESMPSNGGSRTSNDYFYNEIPGILQNDYKFLASTWWQLLVPHIVSNWDRHAASMTKMKIDAYSDPQSNDKYVFLLFECLCINYSCFSSLIKSCSNTVIRTFSDVNQQPLSFALSALCQKYRSIVSNDYKDDIR